MNTATVVSLTVTLIVAVGGYVAKYVNDLRIHQRQGRLNRIERQLSELYGPLLALSYAGRVGWDAAVDDIRPHGRSFGEQDFSEEEFETFRLWMTEVLQPVNRELVDVIKTKSDLLVEDEMPTVLLQVCANVLAFEAVLKRWEQNDHTRKWSFIRFPGTELQQYADTSFATLKSDQVALLGKLQLSRWSRRR